MTEQNKKSKTAQKKTLFRRITGIIGYVIIFLIAAVFVVVIGFKANNRTAFIFGKAPVWVMTSSMEPEIPERSYILIQKATADDIKVGDVIMFKSDDPTLKGANNTHRVVEISEDGKSFITKGDANQSNDSEPAKAENIVGVYVKNLPVLTAIGRFLFSKIGIIITLTVIFAIVMVIYVPDIIKATKKKSNELEQKRQARIDELVRAEVERLKQEKEDTAKPSEEDPVNSEEEPDSTPADEAPAADENEEAPADAASDEEETNASGQETAKEEADK